MWIGTSVNRKFKNSSLAQRKDLDKLCPLTSQFIDLNKKINPLAAFYEIEESSIELFNIFGKDYKIYEQKRSFLLFLYQLCNINKLDVWRRFCNKT